MKTIFLRLLRRSCNFLACLCTVLLISLSANAQTIILNGNAANTGQCMGGASFVLTLQGCTATGQWYIDQALGLASTGGTGTYLTTPNTTTTANYCGPLKVFVPTTSGLLQRTFMIYPTGDVAGYVSGPSSFYETATFTSGVGLPDGASDFNWWLTYNGDAYDIIAGQGTSQVTIKPKMWAPIKSDVEVYGSFKPVGTPCANPYAKSRIRAQRIPYVTYDNPNGNVLCSSYALHVNVADNIGANYPGAPVDAGYKHFTYQWKKDGVAIPGATTKDYTPTVAARYTCDVTQIGWYLSYWSSEGVKTSNFVDVWGEAAHTAKLVFNGTDLSTTMPTAYTCQPVTITTNASGNEKSYSISIYKNSSTASTVVYEGPTINGVPPASFDLKDYLPLPLPANLSDIWYDVLIRLNNGCGTYNVYGSIKLYTPPTAPATFTINGSAANSVTSYTCNPINFLSTSSGPATAWQLEILNSGGSTIYNTGKKYTALPSAAIDLRTLYALTSNNTFKVRYTVFDSCIIDSRTVTLNIPAPIAINPGFKINDSTVNSATPLNVYNCKPITFMGNSIGVVAYSLDILQGGLSVYSSGTVTGIPPSSLDLRNLCSTSSGTGICDYLATHTGVYKIVYTLFNGCVSNKDSGLINVLAPVTNIWLITQRTDLITTIETDIRSHNDPLAPDVVGRYSTKFILQGGSTDAAICSYEYGLERFDIGTGLWVPVGTIQNVITTCDPTIARTIPWSRIGGPAYLVNSAPNNCLYRLTVNLKNECGSNYLYTIFTIDDTKYDKRSGNSNETVTSPNTVQFAPIPFKNSVSATITLSEAAKVSMKVYTIDGRLVNEMKETEMQAGQNFQSFQADTWASGIYFYQCTIGKEVFTGKIVKE